MKNPIQKFYEFLDRPLFPWGRVLLALAVVPLVLSFLMPLWRITLTAPQYPSGLYVDIFSYMVKGGNNGQHLQEINTINHYIGMHHIDRAALTDLDWMPFALGILALLTLRVAAIGSVRSLVDLSVISMYVLFFALGRFYYKLYQMGHDLDPTAPVRVPPFTPIIFGKGDIANFTIESYPRGGAICVGLFAAMIVGAVAWHLIAGRRQAVREARAREAAAVSATPSAGEAAQLHPSAT